MSEFNLSGNPDDLEIGKVNQHQCKLHFSKENTQLFISKTLNRMKLEIGNYIDFLMDYNESHSNQSIGYFSLPRLLFPEIEAIGKLLFPKERGRLLKELGLKYPEIATQLFRNSLIHQTNPCSLKFGDIRISWSIGIDNSNHEMKTYKELGLAFITPSGEEGTGRYFRYHIDMSRLYKSLVKFCQEYLRDEKMSEQVSLIPFTVEVPMDMDKKQKKRHKNLITEIKFLDIY